MNSTSIVHACLIATDYLTRIRDAGIPIMIVQGDKDTAVPVENSRQWIETIKKLNVKHKYIELKNGDHGTVINDGMPDIVEFFSEHPKTGGK